MPKDYKDTPSPRGARGDSRLNHPLLLGVIIGLLMGVVISLAVALWLNRLSNPFVERGRTADAQKAPLQPGAAPDALHAHDKGKGSAPDKAAKPERPRFEFYQILPGDKAAPAPEPNPAAKAPPAAAPTPGPVASAPSAAPAPAAAPKPGSSPGSPKPHSGDNYWLQAGAFAEEKEADNLKARIALTGLEASVRAVAVPDKGKLYRVRLGPYQSVDDANRIKAVLSQNGVAAAIIRSTDEAR